MAKIIGVFLFPPICQKCIPDKVCVLQGKKDRPSFVRKSSTELE